MSRSRCTATTNNGTKCKKLQVNGVYCSTHHRIFVHCENVGQSSAIYFDIEDNGPGLIKDVWELIGNHLNSLDYRVLSLSCKTMFNLLTSDLWYNNKEHIRYLLLEDDRGYPVASEYQDEISKNVKYHKMINRVTKIRYNISLDEKINNPNALYVVNSYIGARKLYRLLDDHGKVKAHSIHLDKNADEIRESLYSLVLYLSIKILGDDFIYKYDNTDIVIIEAINDSRLVNELLLTYIQGKYPEAKLVSSNNKLYFHRI